MSALSRDSKNADDKTNPTVSESSVVRRLSGLMAYAKSTAKLSIDKMKTTLIDNRRNRKKLARARRDVPFSNNPLITVRIATYENSKMLIERTIPSVLNQSYQDFEILIVGDGCTLEHVNRIQTFLNQTGDGRIRFENLAQRGTYPSNPHDRWLVAGATPMNRALELARGEWIAPLDDDDEFTPTHIEDLLRLALDHGYEFVYGIAEMEQPDDKWTNVGSTPLSRNEVCHLAVMYHRRLAFMRYDATTWKRNEATDSDMWQRMKGAGARIGFLPKTVGYHYKERTRSGL